MTTNETLNALGTEEDRATFHKWVQAASRQILTEGATATDVYEDYCYFCEDQHLQPLALPTFDRLARGTYFEKYRSDHTGHRRVHMRLKSGGHDHPSENRPRPALRVVVGGAGRANGGETGSAG